MHDARALTFPPPRDDRPPSIASPLAAALIAGVALLAGVVGCAGGGGDDGAPARDVDAAAFRVPDVYLERHPAGDSLGTSTSAGERGSVPAQAEPTDGAGERAARDSPARRSLLSPESPPRNEAIVVISGDQARAQADDRSAVVGQRVLVDAKVGDINGRAIYADDFLEPLASRFIAQRDIMEPAVWLNDLEKEVRRGVDELVQEELLRAEALASMPDEQRTFGLNAFVTRMRETLESRNLGSRTRAESSIVEEFGEGVTIDEFLRRQQDRELVRLILQSRVRDRVNISWREITQEYARSQDVFNPKPRAFFRWIRVPADDAATISDIQQRLDAGEPFAGVATIEANRFNREGGGLLPPVEVETEIADVKVFLIERLNEAAVALGEGAWTGPIEVRVGSTAYANWVQLERIERIRVPLYDAQLAIAQTREREETERELDRYIRRLLERASFTDMDQMTERLTRIAIERFHPSVMPMYERRLAARNEPG